jgi:hypothetical protein
MQKLTRRALQKIVLEERRNITRHLIMEGGCGCGGCSSCKSALNTFMNTFAPGEDDDHDEVDGLVISYDDTGMPAPSNYIDYATSSTLGHDDEGKNYTMGGHNMPGHDITHGDDYGQSYMAQQHLSTIMNAVQHLDVMIHGDEELEDWCESKLAVAASMVQAVANFVSYHKGAAHPEAESMAPMHGMHSLAHLLDDE